MCSDNFLYEAGRRALRVLVLGRRRAHGRPQVPARDATRRRRQGRVPAPAARRL